MTEKVEIQVEGGAAESEASAREFADAMKRSQERHAAMIERWTGDNREQMRRLCAGFPSLRGKPGTDPFRARPLLEWSLSGAATSASRQAVLFCLQVWNSSTDWVAAAREWGIIKPRAKRFAPFNVARAFQCWDEHHRNAFLAWANCPFNP